MAGLVGHSSPATVAESLTPEGLGAIQPRLVGWCGAEGLLFRPRLRWTELCQTGDDSNGTMPR